MLFFRRLNPYKHSISPLTMKSNQNFEKLKVRKQITWKLKEKDSNYPKKQNFLGVMNKTKLQTITKVLKDGKQKHDLTLPIIISKLYQV